MAAKPMSKPPNNAVNEKNEAMISSLTKNAQYLIMISIEEFLRNSYY